MIIYVMDNEDSIIDEFYAGEDGFVEPIVTPSEHWGRDYTIGNVNGNLTIVIKDKSIVLKGVMHEAVPAVYQTREHQNDLVEITD